ncbi:hypothetical protein M5K25_001855 [Dendrobium thyrsiflorum]|uniref:RNase H type-1 domain-containing protein n=1 Tax=Dendrobium thyrsiflorum TaxID=117978 RepID=A0ABD0VRJ9_DENTH
MECFVSDNSWNEEEVMKFFGKPLVELIMQIEINRDFEEDKLELCNSFSGNKISKLLRHAEEADVEGRLHWKWIRKLDLSPQVACFWRRLLIEALPTTDFLMRRRLLTFNSCLRGCMVVEDRDHITTSCAKLMQVITRLSRWGLIIPMYSSFVDCFHQLKNLSNVNPFIAKLYCSVVFYSWRSRNKVVHEGHELNVDFIASEAVSLASIQSKFNPLSGNWGAFQHELSLSVWHPPPPEWVKVNVDAIILRSNEAGVGGVFRDHQGRFLSAFGFKCLHWDNGFLELFAFRSLRRVIKEWRLEAKVLVIEGDNANVINYLQESFFKVVNLGHEEVLEDFSFLMGFDSIIFNHEKGKEKPKFKKGKQRTQKGFSADSASDSSEIKEEEEATNLCLMTKDHLDHSDQEKEEVVVAVGGNEGEGRTAQRAKPFPGCAAATVGPYIHTPWIGTAVVEPQMCQNGSRKHQTFPPADQPVNAGGEELFYRPFIYIGLERGVCSVDLKACKKLVEKFNIKRTCKSEEKGKGGLCKEIHYRIGQGCRIDGFGNIDPGQFITSIGSAIFCIEEVGIWSAAGGAAWLLSTDWKEVIR